MIRPLRLNPRIAVNENPAGLVIGAVALLAAAGGAAWYFSQGSSGRGKGVDEKLEADHQNPQQIFADGSPTKRITLAEAEALIEGGTWRWANAVKTAITDKPIEKHKFQRGEGKNARGMAIGKKGGS
jgi:hypothetical protein